MQIISGIYKITNLINGKFYIGSAVNIKNRWRCHISELNNRKHGNNYLQNAWNKHHSEETKQKMSNSHKGKIILEKTKQKLIKSWTEEKKFKQSEKLKGKNHPNYGNIGEKSIKAKLTWKKINYIREQYKLYKETNKKLGFNQTQLAKEFNTSQGYIAAIIRNKTWRRNIVNENK